MAFLFLFAILLIPIVNFKFAEAGCGCCCCCPSCCCKPIIIKLPPPPVKLCPCCCGCCCCKPCCCCCPCCCCGGGGGRKKRSVVDLMAKKFSDVLLPQLNQDAMIPGLGNGCGGQQTMPALAPLHSLCSQIPPAQRGPACQQITSQQFPLSQNIFNQQPGPLATSNGASGDFDCQCGNCAGASCAGNCNGGQCTNCAAANGRQQDCAGGMSLCGAQMPGNAFRQANNDAESAPAFNFAQNFAASSPCGSANGSGRKKRALLLLRKLIHEPEILSTSDEKNGSNIQGRKEAKRETKNQNQSLVFRNNLEFVVRQSPPQNI